MFGKIRSVLVRSLFVCIVLLTTAIVASPQETSQFRYVIPRFGGTPGTELILSNLSSAAAQATVKLLSVTGSVVGNNSVDIPAGSQMRLDSTFFAVAGDTVVVDSSTPLSVMGTLRDTGGIFDNAGPAAESNRSILPVFPDAAYSTDISLFNADSIPAMAYILAVGSDGFPVATAQRFVPASRSITASVSSLFPTRSRDISYLDVRVPSNVLSPERHLFAQARIREFSDAGILNAPAPSSALQNPVLPFFVQGGDFVTTLEVVNPSNTPVSGTIFPLGTDGRILTIGTAFNLPANGSLRGTADSLLYLGTDVVVGSIVFSSDAPILVTEGIGNAGRGTFAVTPAIAPDTNFVFSHRSASQSAASLTLLNQNLVSAHLSLRDILDDGTLISQTSLTLDPLNASTRTLTEIFPELFNPGFVYISSDIPIVAAAFEGSINNVYVGNVPAMHAMPDYTPPTSTQLRISGTVRSNGIPVPGVRIQLTGPVSLSTVTGQLGRYSFLNVPAGQYSVDATSDGFILIPASKTVTVTTGDSLDNDFEAIPIRPTITGVQPNSISAGSPDTVVTVTGAPFSANTQIVLDGTALQTTLTSSVPPALQATIPAAALAVPRQASLWVQTAVGAVTVISLPVNFVIANVVTGLPNLVSISPTITDVRLAADAGPLAMTITGSNFAAGATVSLNDADVTTQFNNSTSLTAMVPASALQVGGTYQVSVKNPAPSPGSSSTLPLLVNNVVPILTSIDAASLQFDPAHPSPVSVTLRGDNFGPNSIYELIPPCAAIYAANRISSQAAVLNISLQCAGTYQTRVRTPQPGGGVSQTLSFTVN